MTLTLQMRAEYQRLYDTCQTLEKRRSWVDLVATRVGNHWARYEAVVLGSRIPWQWIGIVHLMESGLDFTKHLHNGDPLTARTIHVPKGQPVDGYPPFDWEYSAKDALRSHGLYSVLKWDIPQMLFQFERWNGFGYRAHGIKSPYLWSDSHHYTRGKFIADGKFDPIAVSKQDGAAVILKRLQMMAPVAVGATT